MKDNYETCLMGSKSVLVPYRPEHVEKYHEWMKSPYLLEMTGSEPLTLEEEIEMQQSWKNDSEKCTFIVLAKCTCPCSRFIKDIEEGNNYQDEMNLKFDFVLETLEAMIGDVNLFLSDIETDYDGENEEEKQEKQCQEGRQAELDIMIAEEKYTRMGIGTEASLLMMLYGAQNLGIRKYVVKIKEENTASRKMFEKLGFKESNYAACFKEFELEYTCSSPEEMAKEMQNIYKKRVYEWKSLKRA